MDKLKIIQLENKILCELCNILFKYVHFLNLTSFMVCTLLFLAPTSPFKIFLFIYASFYIQSYL